MLTGGAGFIGSHVLDALVKEYEVTVIDRLDTSGNLNRLARHKGNPRVRFFYHDLRAPFSDYLIGQLGGRHDYILHLGAATHVDRSIACPMEFVQDNVVATCNILDYARKEGCRKFLQFSTDEVFGPAPPGTAYREWDRYKSGNPYAATKAGAEELAISYHNTYGLPVIVTHTMNVMGQYQHPEKMIPSTIRKVRDGETVVIHADRTKTKAGSRFYIHAKHVADAVLFLLGKGEAGEKYNIVGEQEVDNLELAKLIAGFVGKPLKYEMVDFHSSRPGHDLRYALDGTKMKEMGWVPPQTFEEG
ncbi:MAG TPA: GDP-mannose 4,6-dehydratase, partial [Anaerolineales bacterium]